ncbi:MAG: sigma-70 family RNA polymerase sigma factor [Planctomycetales bacterium]|nr:sigma-70 family RNA polymerase sigma factor [Planctomycetales bacterium]
MTDSANPDALLVEAIRRGEPQAWTDLIDQYEGRLLAFVESRLRRRAASEDVVQETFVGFLTSLPNYDKRRPLESWLFTIAAHKLTDYLRREGRRPAVPLSTADGSGDNWEPVGGARRASSLARSGERHGMEEQALCEGVAEQLDKWRGENDWDKVKCMELLFVAGWGNKQTAEQLGLSEQQVANFKHDFIARLRKSIQRQRLNEDVFPELSE